ncbi:hypothetical protein EJ08DRAFT_117356 [Tothia fuscella]|uniref:Myb-like domain-containing protein n=1 Tax=Tothia fuscella TaxID=1048955 RepID=A0A9P4NW64_9PEZI|nr:hypothetical protein EJ08DRAFT_117356 [Tothia fuscella]
MSSFSGGRNLFQSHWSFDGIPPRQDTSSAQSGSLAMTTIKPGDYYYYNIGGDLWPVVVVSRDTIPNLSKYHDTSTNEIPVLALHKDSFHWVKLKDLEPFDHDAAMAIVSVINDADLRLALEAAIEKPHWSYWEYRARHLDVVHILDMGVAPIEECLENDSLGKRQRSASIEVDTWAAKKRNRPSSADFDSFTSSEASDSNDLITSKFFPRRPIIPTSLVRDLGMPSASNDTLMDSESGSEDMFSPRRYSSSFTEIEAPWTAAQDAELLRLKEDVVPTLSISHVAKELNAKFPQAQRCRASVNHRYTKFLYPGSLQRSKSAIDYRARALAYVLGGDDDEGHDIEAESSPANKTVALPTADPAVLWSTEEDAEVIRLCERTKPTPFGASLAAAFNANFSDGHRSSSAIQSRYASTLMPGAAQATAQAARSSAVILLDRAQLLRPRDYLSKGSVPNFNGGKTDDTEIDEAIEEWNTSAWTVEEDAELIRLKEKTMPLIKGSRIHELFVAKFKNNTRTQKALNSRYRRILGPTTANSTSPSSARTLALAFLAHTRSTENNTQKEKAFRGPSDAAGHCWTVAEDAELIRLRERVKPAPQGRQLTQLFNRNSAPYVHSDQGLASRYNNSLSEFAAFPGAKDCRAKALAYLDNLKSKFDAVSVLEPDALNNDTDLDADRASGNYTLWTLEEDAELIDLKEKKPQEAGWQKISHAYHSRFPRANRASGSISARYRKYLAPGLHDASHRVTAMEFLDRGPLESQAIERESKPSLSTSNAHGTPYSVREDAELINIRENLVPKGEWQEVTSMFNARLSKSRSISSVSNRYNRVFNPSALFYGDEFAGAARKNALAFSKRPGCNQEDHDDPVSSPSGSKTAGIRFSIKEDAELLELKEGSMTTSTWAKITEACNQKRPSGISRTENSISSRYIKILGPLAHLHTGDSARIARQNALAFQPAKQEQDEDAGNNDEEVTILVGPDNIPFDVPIGRLMCNSYFIDDAREDEIYGTVISGSRWRAISEDDFIPVYEYLKEGDYNPPLAEEDDSLSGVDTDDDYGKEIARCGEVFALARQMLLWDLVSKTRYSRTNSRFMKMVILREPIEDDNFHEMLHVIMASIHSIFEPS